LSYSYIAQTLDGHMNMKYTAAKKSVNITFLLSEFGCFYFVPSTQTQQGWMGHDFG